MAKNLRGVLVSFFIAISLLFAGDAHAHNVTRLLAKHPSFSTFSHYLTQTHLADEINRRTTITICAVENSAMSDIISKGYTISTIKNILSLHVLLDYFGAKKLHQIRDGSALAATLFQATGSAPGTTGFVNITDLRGGKVGFGPDGGDLSAFFVKSLEEVPYNISIIQISKVLPSEVAAAPTPAPAEMNLTGIMSAHGCKVFAEALLANPGASKTYQESVEGGMTVFCPGDEAMKGFMPKYKNLTGPNKEAFMEFLAVPTYYSMAMLKSNNGPMNTLATDGANKFELTVQNDGDDVTLRTRIDSVKITDTLIDEEPLAIYATDKVLLPKELFKVAEAPTPSPAPAPEDEAADSPKASKGKKKKKTKEAPSPDSLDDSESPADSPEGDNVADQTADDAGDRIGGGAKFGFVMSLLCFCASWLL
ncbi:PREDICTED: fasciclin-like arabinogalactan protein 1 [Tarenaya hassleriana]|uniref:fasciclin-like arabinogalactan protein 1 n=1 Tax=Tarenaya hassleriana TaxID=28532 RepID=UPI00053C1775|nr:PREDICTED: fasciclin-like arabinogalactan protein 1 [Tarenaya hassleriana]